MEDGVISDGYRLVVNHFTWGDHLARAFADGSFFMRRGCGVFTVFVRPHRPVRTMTASDETEDSQCRHTDSSPVLHRSISPFRRIHEIDSVSCKGRLASDARHAKPHAE